MPSEKGEALPEAIPRLVNTVLPYLGVHLLQEHLWSNANNNNDFPTQICGLPAKLCQLVWIKSLSSYALHFFTNKIFMLVNIHFHSAQNITRRCEAPPWLATSFDSLLGILDSARSQRQSQKRCSKSDNKCASRQHMFRTAMVTTPLILRNCVLNTTQQKCCDDHTNISVDTSLCFPCWPALHLAPEAQRCLCQLS